MPCDETQEQHPEKKNKFEAKARKAKQSESKPVSYSSSAKTYSKDLKHRRVTQQDLLIASLPKEARESLLNATAESTAHQWESQAADRQTAHDSCSSQTDSVVEKRDDESMADDDAMVTTHDESSKPFIGPVIPKEYCDASNNVKDIKQEEKLTDSGIACLADNSNEDTGPTAVQESSAAAMDGVETVTSHDSPMNGILSMSHMETEQTETSMSKLEAHESVSAETVPDGTDEDAMTNVESSTTACADQAVVNEDTTHSAPEPHTEPAAVNEDTAEEPEEGELTDSSDDDGDTEFAVAETADDTIANDVTGDLDDGALTSEADSEEDNSGTL